MGLGLSKRPRSRRMGRADKVAPLFPLAGEEEVSFREEVQTLVFEQAVFYFLAETVERHKKKCLPVRKPSDFQITAAASHNYRANFTLLVFSQSSDGWRPGESVPV